jgi:hypothetical protein
LLFWRLTQLQAEPSGFDYLLQAALAPVWRTPAPKSMGDFYLLALSKSLGSTLVTFDTALATACRKSDCNVVLPKGA